MKTMFACLLLAFLPAGGAISLQNQLRGHSTAVAAYDPITILCTRRGGQIAPWCSQWVKCIQKKATPDENPAAVMAAWKPASCKEVCGVWPARGSASLIQKPNASTALTFLDLHSMAPNECVESCINFQKSLSTCVATIMFDQGRIAQMAGPPPGGKAPPAICSPNPEEPLVSSPCVMDLPIRHQKCIKHRTAKILDPDFAIPDDVAKSCKLIASQMDKCKDCPQLNGDYRSQYVAFTGGCMDQLNAYWTASNYGAAGRAAIPAEQGCRVHTAAQIKAAKMRAAAKKLAAEKKRLEALAKKAAEVAAAKERARVAAVKKAKEIARKLAEAKAAAALAKKKAAEAAAKKKAEEAAAKKKAEELARRLAAAKAAAAAAKKKAEEVAAAKKKAEEAAAKKKAEELAKRLAAAKAAAAAAKKKAEIAAAKKKAEELAKRLAAAKAAAAAAKKKAEEVAAAKKKAEEAAAKRKAEELAKRLAAAKAAAAAAKKKAEEAAAKKKAEEAAAKKRAEELAKRLAAAKAAAALAKRKAKEAAAAQKAKEAAAAKKAKEAAAKKAAAAAAVKAAEAKAAAAKLRKNLLKSHGGWNFYKVPTKDTGDAGIKAACAGAGLVTPCAGGSGCRFNGGGCTMTSETGCGMPMWVTAKALCGGRTYPSKCAPFTKVYTFMGYKWVGKIKGCGISSGHGWCDQGAPGKSGYAFCAERR